MKGGKQLLAVDVRDRRGVAAVMASARMRSRPPSPGRLALARSMSLAPGCWW